MLMPWLWDGWLKSGYVSLSEQKSLTIFFCNHPHAYGKEYTDGMEYRAGSKQKRSVMPLWLLVLICAFLTGLFAVLVITFESAISSEQRYQRAQLRNSLFSLGTSWGQQLQQSISQGIFATDALHILLEESDYDPERFDSWAAEISAQSPFIGSLQLAPDGLVTYIYPWEEHKGAFGHDLLADQRRNDGALRAIESRELTFVGPLRLIQNDRLAVIARKPIFADDSPGSFWGFSTAILYVDEMLPDGVRNTSGGDIGVRIVGDDPDQAEPPLFFSNGAEFDNPEVSISIQVPNGTWIMELSSSPPLDPRLMQSRLLVYPIAAFSLLLLILQQIRLRKRSLNLVQLSRELEDQALHDDLTSLANRRLGMTLLTQQCGLANRHGEPLSLAMLDVDNFKEINDKHGHNTGDLVLTDLAKTVNNSIRSSDIVMRLGGDEFLLGFPKTTMRGAREICEKIAAHIHERSAGSVTPAATFSVSMGIAQYLPDEDLENAIARADAQLYRAKERGKNQIAVDQ